MVKGNFISFLPVVNINSDERSDKLVIVMRTSTAMIMVAGTFLMVACGTKQIKKQPVPAEVRFQAIRLMGEGDELFKEGKVHLAMLKYLEASKVNPYEERIFNKLAIAYSRLGMYYQAKRSVDRAIGLNRRYAHAYNTLGILALAGDELKDASNSFRKAIAIEPESASFYINLGFAEVRRGNLEEGLRAYQKAYELKPDLLEGGDLVELDLGGPVDSAGYYQFALIFAELGKLDFCLWYLRKAISFGFDDYDRLLSEPIMQRFKDEETYQQFLRETGIVK
jgi:tetratricopeptide (TPR) repeat protein